MMMPGAYCISDSPLLLLNTKKVINMFILATDDLLLLPDPKMGFLPFSQVDAHMLRKEGGYFIGWWIHPNFLRDAWWKVDTRCVATLSERAREEDRREGRVSVLTPSFAPLSFAFCFALLYDTLRNDFSRRSHVNTCVLDTLPFRLLLFPDALCFSMRFCDALLSSVSDARE